MKYEDIDNVKEIIFGINEIDTFLKYFNPSTNYLCLENAEGKSIFHIRNEQTLIEIEKTLKERKEELIKELQKY